MLQALDEFGDNASMQCYVLTKGRNNLEANGHYTGNSHLFPFVSTLFPAAQGCADLAPGDDAD